MKRNSILEKIRQARAKYVDIFVDNSFDLSSRIQFLMDKNNMDQKTLAKYLDKNESEISKWMSGSHNFTLKTLAKIEDILGDRLFEVCLNEINNNDKAEIIIKYQEATFNYDMKSISCENFQKYTPNKTHGPKLEPVLIN